MHTKIQRINEAKEAANMVFKGGVEKSVITFGSPYVYDRA